jgi:hypothetical protein
MFGQRIVYARSAEESDSNRWFCADLDRGIYFSFYSSYQNGPEKQHVMAAYDNSLYTYASPGIAIVMRDALLALGISIDENPTAQRLPKNG